MGIRRQAKVASVVVWRYLKNLMGVAVFVICSILAVVAAMVAGAGILCLFWRGVRIYLFGGEVHYRNWGYASGYGYYDESHSTIDICVGRDLMLGIIVLAAIFFACWGLSCLFAKVKKDAKTVNEEIEMKENPHLFAAQEKGQLSLPFDGECSLSLVDGEGTLSLVGRQEIAH